MKKFNILHISPTPLVDSPRKINDQLNISTHFKSNIFIFNDYPGKLKGVFSSNTLIYNKNSKDIILNLLQSADIIHIHNFLTKEQENIVLTNTKSDIKFIYQVHSPLREGPLFVEYAEESSIKFSKKCVVSQYHPRLYPSYKYLPNLVLFKSNLKLIDDNEEPKILFSPAHSRTRGRWNDKKSPNLDKTLESIKNLGLAEVIFAEGYTPHELFELRKQCHISIDEIVTGSYHQISLESLCAGNLTINNSDLFTNLVLKSIIGVNDKIPFFKSSESEISENLLELIQNKKKIREYQQKSFDFYNKYLLPEKLIEKYVNIYKEVLNDN